LRGAVATKQSSFLVVAAKLDCFASLAMTVERASPRNRQLRRGIEEVQPSELRRDPHLIAGRDFHLRGHTGDRQTIRADACLQQDFRAELLDDFDAGLETGAGRAVAE